MDYVDYPFYTDEWHGSLPEPIFNKYLIRAVFALNCMTIYRIDRIWDRLTTDEKDAIRYAICALIDKLNSFDKYDGKEVSTEIVAQHHVSFFQMSTSQQTQLRALVQTFLCGIRINGRTLFFRGLETRCCEC